MHFSKIRNFFILAVVSALLTGFADAQAKPGDGSIATRLEVMRQKLETIRRSAASSASVLKEEVKDDKTAKDDKTNLDTPINRLRSIEKRRRGFNPK